MDARGWEGTEALGRHRLLLRMTFAAETRNRRYADRILVEATRCLKRHDGDDPVIHEAQKHRSAPALLLALFTGVRGRGILRSPYAGC
jgi:hypothetical protein